MRAVVTGALLVLLGAGMGCSRDAAPARTSGQARAVLEALPPPGDHRATVDELVDPLAAQHAALGRRFSAPFTLLRLLTPQGTAHADAVKRYYDNNPNEFRIPEQVRVEYVTLTMDALMAGIPVDEAQVRRYYDENRAQFETKQERQASHILIAVDAAASAEDKQKARARAEELGWDGLFLATGFSGHGFGIGPAAGYVMAQLARGEQPVVDLAPFRLARFAEGDVRRWPG